jgi:hypothetical protein
MAPSRQDGSMAAGAVDDPFDGAGCVIIPPPHRESGVAVFWYTRYHG